ncbi:MAG TPA: hypothetical protein VLK27_09325 [Chthoniobacterales bacterium]|nr:hypothetical protein [Chthoniobacterales bacterium]
MEKLTKRDSIFAVNVRRMNRALFGVLGLVSLAAVALPAARASDFDPIFGFYRPELFANIDISGLLRNLPMTEYLDGRLPGSTALGKMGTAPVGDLPTALVSAEPRQKNKAVSGPVKDPKDGKDYSSVESMAVEKASLSWTGGEVGFMYGHASGKFGGDTFSSYIMGGVGNDHLQINVGAGYEETHFSRSRH